MATLTLTAATTAATSAASSLALGTAATGTAAATTGLFGVGGQFALGQTLLTGIKGISAISSIKSGYAQQAATQRQAEAEELAYKERELNRLKTLREIQAAQRATWAGRGISPYSGSPATIAKESVRAYELERGADLASKSRELDKLRVAGDSAVTSGWVKAGGITASILK